MRSGRPNYHIKARFISFYDFYNKTMTYFELDNKGNIIKDDKGKFSSHNERPYAINNINLNTRPTEPKIEDKQTIPPDIPKTSNKESSENIENDLIMNQSLDNEYNSDFFDFGVNDDDSFFIPDNFDYMALPDDLFVDVN